MNYPLISEYVEAIKSAEDNFEELNYLRPVLGDDGLPVMTSGNFAVVFKMKDEQSGKFYAVKCFTKEQEGRAEAYREIAKELKDVSSPYLVSIQYLEKELFVDTDQTTETEFPVLLMDWVEGKTLDKFLRENLDDKYALEMLAYRFSQLAQWLIPQSFAHGDLKPDNILVREDGTLVLVDYDGMYVHTMYGQHAREMGSPDYRHPQRSRFDFDSHIDDFPLVSILLSLEAININPHLFEKYCNDRRLLFSSEEYLNLGESVVFNEIFPNSYSNINNLSSILMLLCNNKHLHIQHTELLGIDCLSTDTTDYSEELRDEDGAVYSNDGKRLLGYGSYDNTDIYKIKEGTIVICDLAFNNYENDNHFLRKIHIPPSVSIIGINPFAGCIGLSINNDSKWFKIEDSILYTNDYSRLISSTNSTKETLQLNNETSVIGAYALSFCGARSINLPIHLKFIEEYAFSFSNVEYLIIPHVKSIDKNAFSHCESLANVIFRYATIIDPSIFDDCKNLQHIFVLSSDLEYFKKMLPNVANIIYGFGYLEDCIFGDVNFAKEIYGLGRNYWDGKDVDKDLNEAISLYEFAAELGYSDAIKEYKEWGKYWIDENKALYSKNRETFEGVLWGVYEYEIKEGTKYIADSACSDMGWEIDCSYFSKLTIPKSVIGIGDNPFGCQMREVICLSPFFEVENGTLYSKGKKELIQCFNNENNEFIIPEGVEVIRSFAFYSCSLRKIVIPHSITEIQKNPFVETGIYENNHIRLEVISNSPIFTICNNALYKGSRLISCWGTYDCLEVPNGVEEIGDRAFWGAEVRTIKLPLSLNTVAEDAFYWIDGLEWVIVSKEEDLRFRKFLPEYIKIIVEETI